MPRLYTVDVHAFDLLCLRVLRFSPGRTILLLVLLVLLPGVSSAAVTNYIWIGSLSPGASNARWDRLPNWSATNTVPPANNISGLTNSLITFTGLRRLSPFMQDDYYVRGLVFDPLAGSFVLRSQGNRELTVGESGIVNFSSSPQSILGALTVASAQTWNANAGDLLLTGRIDLGLNPLTIDGPQDVSLQNIVQGSGQLIKVGAGNLQLGGTSPNTYSGGTVLNGGTITAGKAGAMGSGSVTLNAGTLNLGTFNHTVGTFTLNGGTVLGGGIISASAYQIRSGALNVRLGGSAPLVKSGVGTTTVTTANLFTGGTLINGGTLAINNLTGSGTGTGNVSINSGGTLVGFGAISGTVTNAFGGTISAGDDIGQLDTGSQFWLGGSTNRWEISDAAGAAGVGWDLLNITGTLNILATASNPLTLDVVSFTLGGVPGEAANFDPSVSYTWRIAQTSGGISFVPGEDWTQVFEVMASRFANPLNGGGFDLAVSNGGRDLDLVYTPAIVVPEPDKLAFAAVAVCVYVYGRRFKRHWRAERPLRRPPQPSNTATAAA
jgi:autotransporter-associated beta strand protein